MENYKNTMKFRETCNKMGLDWNHCQTYEIGGDTLTILKSPVNDLFVFFDHNSNLIGIEEFKFGHFELFVETFYGMYSDFTDILPFGDQFGYPFEDFTLKDIVDISSRVEVIETNHGHSLEYIINGEKIDSNLVDCKHQLGLSYIKFLGEEIEQYFISTYSLRTLGYRVPDIYDYLRNIISKVEECIKSKIASNTRPYPYDIFSTLGQDSSLYDSILLYDIIHLLMTENNYQCVTGTTDQIEKISISEDSSTRLNVIMNELKEIPNLKSNHHLYQKKYNLND